jgi:hypothetical protein
MNVITQPEQEVDNEKMPSASALSMKKATINY